VLLHPDKVCNCSFVVYQYQDLQQMIHRQVYQPGVAVALVMTIVISKAESIRRTISRYQVQEVDNIAVYHLRRWFIF